MRDKLAKKLADPELYEDARKGELATWNGKYAELMEALDKAEALWLTAQEEDEDYPAFIARAAQNPIARRVKRADLLDNLDVRRLPEVTEKSRLRLNKYLRALEQLDADPAP
jgi:5'-deoxynucleotidase YfbR-like HD superfamily hydrolase